MPWFHFEWKRLVIYGPVTWFRAGKGGVPLFRGQATWRDINGVMLNSRHFGFYVWVVWRRRGPAWKA